MYSLKINPQVYDDLKDIRDYIAQDSEQNAEKVVSEIISDIERLREFPNIGAKLSNRVMINPKYRYIITYSYASIYFVDGETVYVVTVLHLARDFSALNLQ